jgi:hypothetical protein
MKDMNELEQALETLDDPEARALFRAAGKLPDMKRGQMVWVWFNDEWRAAEVERRLPGQVYWAKFDCKVDGFRRVVLSLGNFGGLWK